ncbi:MAG: hypothetical protein R3E32_14925 [Chitinophagales bacterium]
MFVSLLCYHILCQAILTAKVAGITDFWEKIGVIIADEGFVKTIVASSDFCKKTLPNSQFRLWTKD